MSAKISTSITAEAAPATPTVTDLPEVVELNGPYMTVIHKAAALIRRGYMPESVTSFGPAWPMTMTLRIGDPEQAYIDAAIVDVAEARALEEHHRQQEIRDEARRIVEAQAKAARQAELDAAIAEQERSLAALKAAHAAA